MNSTVSIIPKETVVLVSSARHCLHEHPMRNNYPFRLDQVVNSIPEFDRRVVSSSEFVFKHTDALKRWLGEDFAGPYVSVKQLEKLGYIVVATGCPDWPYIVLMA